MKRVSKANEETSVPPVRSGKGFILPVVERTLKYSYAKFSLCAWLNRAVDKPSTSEVYLLGVLLIGILWLVLIEQPVLIGCPWTWLGVGLLLYWIVELLVFALKWLLADRDPVISFRRSFVCFVLNLVQVAVLFTVLFWLVDAYDPPVSRLDALYRSLTCMFSPGLIDGLRGDSFGLRMLAFLHLFVAWVLVVVILASVVGAIQRREKDDV